VDLQRLDTQYFRASMVAFFLRHSLINERLARSMLGWTHRGFSLDMPVKIHAFSSRAREGLAQYIARPPVSLSKMLVEEPLAGSGPQGRGRHEGSVLYRSECNPYFKTNARLFPAIEFLVQLLQPLRLTHEGARGEHQSARGQKDPPAPHQDRPRPSGPGDLRAARRSPGAPAYIWIPPCPPRLADKPSSYSGNPQLQLALVHVVI